VRGSVGFESRTAGPNKDTPIVNPKEEQFVNTFVLKNRRERSLFELGSPKKRGLFLSSRWLCHEYECLFDNRYLVVLPKSNSDPEAIERTLVANGAGKMCHVISSDDELDGKEASLYEALRICVEDPRPSILICTPLLAYFQAEQYQGPPPRFLLRKK
jgi:hypothetical protein